MANMNEIEDMMRKCHDDEMVNKMAYAYMELIDMEETDFIDDKTFRVHFKDGVNVDVIDDRISSLEDDFDAVNVLITIGYMKRALDDICHTLMEKLFNN